MTDDELKTEVKTWWNNPEAYVSNLRTNQQNAAMWLGCERYAEEFNERGLDMVVVLDKAKMPIRWDKKSVQHNIYNQIAVAMFGRTSSRLDSDEPKKVWGPFTDFTELHWGFHVPWPSEEELKRVAQMREAENVAENAA